MKKTICDLNEKESIQSLEKVGWKNIVFYSRIFAKAFRNFPTFFKNLIKKINDR